MSEIHKEPPQIDPEELISQPTEEIVAFVEKTIQERTDFELEGIIKLTKSPRKDPTDAQHFNWIETLHYHIRGLRLSLSPHYLFFSAKGLDNVTKTLLPTEEWDRREHVIKNDTAYNVLNKQREQYIQMVIDGLYALIRTLKNGNIFPIHPDVIIKSSVKENVEKIVELEKQRARIIKRIYEEKLAPLPIQLETEMEADDEKLAQELWGTLKPVLRSSDATKRITFTPASPPNDEPNTDEETARIFKEVGAQIVRSYTCTELTDLITNKLNAWVETENKELQLKGLHQDRRYFGAIKKYELAAQAFKKAYKEKAPSQSLEEVPKEASDMVQAAVDVYRTAKKILRGNKTASLQRDFRFDILSRM